VTGRSQEKLEHAASELPGLETRQRHQRSG
jgi:hypothetical protein